MTTNARKVVEELKAIYLKEDVCMFDLLAEVKIKNEYELSFEDVFLIYGELMNWANGDNVELIRAE